MYKWIDIHAHLDMMDGRAEETLQQAQAEGVGQIFTIGTESKDHGFVFETSKRLFPQVVGTLGVHPHYANQWDEETGKRFQLWSVEQHIVALGEMGLDYFYKQSPIEDQHRAFIAQMELARELKLPVQIHTRDAEGDTWKILSSFGQNVRGVIHCYTGTWDFASKCLDLGYNISFSGIVTFKNAEALREVCDKVPLDRIHVETDAPFLSPVPVRGKKNIPAHVIHTAAFVANRKGVELEKFSEILKSNTYELFPKAAKI